MPDSRTLDIIIPVYNEEECLPALFERLMNVRTTFNSLNVETNFIFVNDYSTDNSLIIIRELSECHEFVKLVSFSRNFGHQIALTAGFDYSDADFTAVIDADLQDPPEVIVEMYKEAMDGEYDIVYGQRASRKNETAFKKHTASLFYRFLNLVCDTDIPKDTGDFRLVSRKVVTEFKRMRERHRFIRGIFPWLGFKTKAYVYDRDERFAGVTKYPLKKMVAFAANAIFSFSNTPLHLTVGLGLAIVLLGFLFSLYMLYVKFFTAESVSGVTSIILSIIIIGGTQITLLGVIGQYIGRIFEETKGRPLYVIEHVANCEKK